MKNIFALILFILSFNILANTVSIKNKESLIVDQKGSYWCWAAVTSSMIKYVKNKKVSQEQIIMDILGTGFITPEMYLSPRLALPISGDLFLESRVFSKYNLNSRRMMSDEIIKKINENKPVLALYQNHAGIIVGYKKTKEGVLYEVIEPEYKIKKLDPIVWKTEKEISEVTSYYPSVLFYFKS